MIFKQNNKELTITFEEADTAQQINTMSEKVYQMFKQNKDAPVKCEVCGFERNISSKECPRCKMKNTKIELPEFLRR